MYILQYEILRFVETFAWNILNTIRNHNENISTTELFCSSYRQ